MDRAEYETMYRAEQVHWWYLGMAGITRRILESFCLPGVDLKILDAGCGTGGTMSWLSGYGRVAGLDLSLHALEFCKKRGYDRVLAASVTALPFAEESFDLVVSLDVLYFQGIQDEAALREFVRVLVPGGRILLRVPAYDWLRGAHDRRLSTGHRYTMRELRQKISRSGLIPEMMTYVNCILFPLALLKRLCERWLPEQSTSDSAIELKPLGGLLKGCLLLESRFVNKRPLPFGLSVMGIGRKPVA